MAGNRIKSKIAFEFLVFETVFGFDVECKTQRQRAIYPSTLGHGLLDREVRDKEH